MKKAENKAQFLERVEEKKPLKDTEQHWLGKQKADQTIAVSQTPMEDSFREVKAD